jgi:predicted dithiol-disulfide oxidoreductase (DUF899 family)
LPAAASDSSARCTWASSFGGDFSVRFTEEQQREGIEYNYRREAAWQPRKGAESGGGAALLAAMSGTDLPTYTRERPGMRAFAIEDGVVYHAYSTY